jgi:hypothetical protein
MDATLKNIQLMTKSQDLDPHSLSLSFHGAKLRSKKFLFLGVGSVFCDYVMACVADHDFREARK